MATKYNITKQQSNLLYTTMKYLNDILLKNDIGYWVTGGSLIGAIRHRGIVPWDDDGDICIMINDVSKLRKLIPKFKKDGYNLEEGTTDQDDDTKAMECTTKHNSCTWFLESTKPHSLGVDIFVMERIGPLITYADPYWRIASNGGKKCYFLYNMVFPLVPVRFGNFWIMTPFNAVEHLNQCYGVDWNSVSQRLFDHREGKWIDSKKIRMEPGDYETIPPPLSTCELKPPSMSKCTNRKGSNIHVDKLLNGEEKIFDKLYKIKGRSHMSIDNLRKSIKNNI